jgi:hypothetical protein
MFRFLGDDFKKEAELFADEVIPDSLATSWGSSLLA